MTKTITQAETHYLAKKLGCAVEDIEEMILRGELTYEDFELDSRPTTGHCNYNQ
jgi:hypothetical protein